MEPKHSINRSFFESSLELKCLLFFSLCLAVIIALSFFLYWEVAGAQIKTQNPRTANLLVVQYLTFRHWVAFQNTSEEGSENEGPDEFVQFMEVLNKRLQNQQYTRRFIWAPDTLLSREFLSDTPSVLQEPTEEDKEFFEKNILSKFDFVLEDYNSESDILEYYDHQDGDGKYDYYQVIRSDKFCNTCHPTYPGIDCEPGQMMGVVHVGIPEPPNSKDAMTKYWAMLFGVAIITAFLSLSAFDMVIRWLIISPLRKLRNVTEGISRGDTSKRADLHTGDEFEMLGEAFNRMLRGLVSAQDKLRRANNQLESNVDELAHLSIQLYETNRLKSDFMATMSHELRTPLNSILGFSDVLGSIDSLNEKQKKYVENINNSGRTLLSMINDILDMAKMESGRMSVSLSTFQISHIVAAQCDMAKPLIDRKNLELQVILEPDLPPMRQDESRIQQILNNLLSNAIKFTPEGGRIRLNVRKTETVLHPHHQDDSPGSGRFGSAILKPIPILELQVSDTGVGISEDDQNYIFEKFRQGSRVSPDGDALKREYTGSGLGLSIVKEICKMLEGEITLESRIGLGSTFTVRLPWTLEEREHTENELREKYQDYSKNRIMKLAQKPAELPEK